MRRGLTLVAVAMAMACDLEPRTVLFKKYHRECLIPAGESFEMATVESMSVCESIARAYNFARVAERPERVDEFGLCWDAYSFVCKQVWLGGPE